MVEVVSQPGVAEQLFELPTSFAKQAEFLACVDSLKKGQSATFDSVWGSACALLTSALAGEFPAVLVVVADAKDADNLLDDLSTFFPNPIERFPACLQGLDSSVTVDLEYGDRLRLTKSLLVGDAGKIVVATVPSLLQSLLPPNRSINTPVASRWGINLSFPNSKPG